jgi:hypothetical protein
MEPWGRRFNRDVPYRGNRFNAPVRMILRFRDGRFYQPFRPNRHGGVNPGFGKASTLG